MAIWFCKWHPRQILESFEHPFLTEVDFNARNISMSIYLKNDWLLSGWHASYRYVRFLHQNLKERFYLGAKICISNDRLKLPKGSMNFHEEQQNPLNISWNISIFSKVKSFFEQMDITISAISMKDDSMGKNFYCYIFFKE